jgi:hypothetical protein
MNLQLHKVAGDKGISEMKSKQQSPCSYCMHRPVMSWGNACSTCMHWPVHASACACISLCMHQPVHASACACISLCMHQPVMSQADEWTYCMGSKVSSLSQIYLYSSYFNNYTWKQHIFRNLWKKFPYSSRLLEFGGKRRKKKNIFFDRNKKKFLFWTVIEYQFMRRHIKRTDQLSMGRCYKTLFRAVIYYEWS